MSDRHRLARALVRLYPRAWRARYGDEMLALIADAGLGPVGAINLCAGAVRERIYALPEERGLTALMVGLFVSEFVNFSAALVGATLREVWIPPPGAFQVPAKAAVLVMLLFFLLRRRGSWEAKRLTLSGFQATGLIAFVWLSAMGNAWEKYSFSHQSWHDYRFDIIFGSAGVFVLAFLHAFALWHAGSNNAKRSRI
jgi:hypothetical protein